MTIRQPDPMRDSLYSTVRGVKLKSCPSCSRDAGRAVFHALDAFGERTFEDGTSAVQPYCGKCRGKYKKAG